MADIGYLRSLYAGIPDPNTRRILIQADEHVLGNLRFGVPEHQARAENFQLYFIQSTTPSTANQEFSVLHGLNTIPHYAIPILELDSTVAQTVNLRTARPADDQRLYLRSASTSAKITLLIEG